MSDRWPAICFMTLLSFVALIGCSDEVLDEDGENEFEIEDSTCQDHEVPHPISGECIADDDDDNDDEDKDCTQDQVFDPDSNECVEVCDDDESYDADSDQCLPEQQECEEDYQWDDELGECVLDEEPGCGMGSIIGVTCRPDQGVIGNAYVTVEGTDCDGDAFTETAVADINGNYAFDDIPSGLHSIRIESGSFSVSDNVVVAPGETTDLSASNTKLCLEGTEASIAVIPGIYDDMMGILDSMQIEYDEITDSGLFLGDLTDVLDYDIIFVECAAFPPWSDPDDDTAANLRRFIEEGNSLYVSDLAFLYIEDTISDDENMIFGPGGGSAGTAVADIKTSEFQALLQRYTIDILFNMSGWRHIETPGPVATVHFEGNVGNADDVPLMVHYDDPIGGGRALYTSFHNSAQADAEIQDIFEHVIFQL